MGEPRNVVVSTQLLSMVGSFSNYSKKNCWLRQSRVICRSLYFFDTCYSVSFSHRLRLLLALAFMLSSLFLWLAFYLWQRAKPAIGVEESLAALSTIAFLKVSIVLILILNLFHFHTIYPSSPNRRNKGAQFFFFVGFTNSAPTINLTDLNSTFNVLVEKKLHLPLSKAKRLLSESFYYEAYALLRVRFRRIRFHSGSRVLCLLCLLSVPAAAAKLPFESRDPADHPKWKRDVPQGGRFALYFDNSALNSDNLPSSSGMRVPPSGEKPPQVSNSDFYTLTSTNEFSDEVSLETIESASGEGMTAAPVVLQEYFGTDTSSFGSGNKRATSKRLSRQALMRSKGLRGQNSKADQSRREDLDKILASLLSKQQQQHQRTLDNDIHGLDAESKSSSPTPNSSVGADPIDYIYVTFMNRSLPSLSAAAAAIAPNAMSFNGSIYVVGGQTRIDLSNPALANGPTPSLQTQSFLSNLTNPPDSDPEPSIVIFPHLASSFPSASLVDEEPLPEPIWGPSGLVVQSSGVYIHHGCGGVGVGISNGDEDSYVRASSSTSVSSRFVRQDIDDGSIKLLPPSPSPRKGAMLIGGIWTQGFYEALYLVGGCDENNVPIRQVDVFSPKDNKWISRSDLKTDFIAPLEFACCGGSGAMRYGTLFMMACDDCSVYNMTFGANESAIQQPNNIVPYAQQNLSFWMFIQSDYDILYSDKEQMWSRFPDQYFNLFLNRRGDLISSNCFVMRDFLGFLLVNPLFPGYETPKGLLALLNMWNFDVHVFTLASDEVPTSSEYYSQDSLYPGPVQGMLNFSTVVSSNNHLFVVGGSQKIGNISSSNPLVQGASNKIYQINDLQPSVNIFFYDEDSFYATGGAQEHLTWEELSGAVSITTERRNRFLARSKYSTPMPSLVFAGGLDNNISTTTPPPLSPDSLPYYSYPNTTTLYVNKSKKVKLIAYPAHIALYVKLSATPNCDNDFDGSMPRQMTGVTPDGLGSTFLVEVSSTILNGGYHYICISPGVCPIKHDKEHGDAYDDFIPCTFPPYADFNINDTSPSVPSLPSVLPSSGTSGTYSFSFPSLTSSNQRVHSDADSATTSLPTEGGWNNVADRYDPRILNQSSVACLRAGCCYDVEYHTCYFYSGAPLFWLDWTLTWDIALGISIYLNPENFPTIPDSTISTTTVTEAPTPATTETTLPTTTFPITTAVTTATPTSGESPFMTSPLFYATLAGGALLLLVVIIFIAGMFRMCCCRGVCCGWRYGKDPSVTGYVHESVEGGGEDGELNFFIKKSFYRSGNFFGPMLFTDVNGRVNAMDSNSGHSLHTRDIVDGEDGDRNSNQKFGNRSFSSTGSNSGAHRTNRNSAAKTNSNRVIGGADTPLLLSVEDDEQNLGPDCYDNGNKLISPVTLFPGAYTGNHRSRGNSGGAVCSGKFNNSSSNSRGPLDVKAPVSKVLHSDPPSRRNLDTRDLQEQVALAQSRRSDFTYEDFRYGNHNANNNGRQSRYSEGDGSNGSNGLMPSTDFIDHPTSNTFNNLAASGSPMSQRHAPQYPPVPAAVSAPPPLPDSEGYKLVRKCGRGAHGLVFAAIASTRYGVEPNYHQIGNSLADLRKSFYDRFKTSLEDPNGGMNDKFIPSQSSSRHLTTTLQEGYCRPSELINADSMCSGSLNFTSHPHHHPHTNAMALALEQLQFLQQSQQIAQSGQQGISNTSVKMKPQSKHRQSSPLPPLFAIKFIRCETEDDMAVAIKEYNVIERIHGQPNLIYVHHVFVYQSFDGVEPHEGMFVCPEADEEDDEAITDAQDPSGGEQDGGDEGLVSNFGGGVRSQGRHHSSRFTFGTLNTNTSRLSKTFGRRRGQQLQRKQQQQQQGTRNSPSQQDKSNNAPPKLDMDSLYLCIVTDYYPAGDLRRFIKGFPLRHLPEATVLHVAIQLGRGLAYMHQQSPPMVHRDIKPENVLLGLNGDVVITDFGLAHNDMKTYMTTMAGTIHFAAPETFKKHYTSAIDVWGVGCILYAMCSRRADAENSRIMFSDARDVGFEEEVHAELGSYDRYIQHNQSASTREGGGGAALFLTAQSPVNKDSYTYYNSTWNQTTTSPTPMQTQTVDSASFSINNNNANNPAHSSHNMQLSGVNSVAANEHLPSNDGRSYSYELVCFILSMLRPDPRQRPTAANVVSRAMTLLEQRRGVAQSGTNNNTSDLSPHLHLPSTMKLAQPQALYALSQEQSESATNASNNIPNTILPQPSASMPSLTADGVAAASSGSLQQSIPPQKNANVPSQEELRHSYNNSDRH